MPDTVQRLDQQMAVRLETHINAPPEKVWQSLATTAGMKAWLGPDQYEGRLGAQFVMNVTEGDNQYRMFGEVITFDPPNELAFTWQEEHVGVRIWPAATTVTVTLTPEDGGTRVTLTHHGFDQLPAAIAQDELAGYVEGWSRRPIMQLLKQLVEG